MLFSVTIMTANTDLKLELERLRAEIAQEKKMRNVLEESVRELRQTCDELESRLDGIDDESNEWKTRYETQCEMNQQLEKQSMGLQDRIDEAKKTLKEGRLPKSWRESANPEMSAAQLSQLEREKRALAGTLKDLEWKLDQEAKAYHQANEERSRYITEIASAKDQTNENRKKAIGMLSDAPRAGYSSNPNVPYDQRPYNTQYAKKPSKVLPPRN